MNICLIKVKKQRVGILNKILLHKSFVGTPMNVMHTELF